MIASQRSCRLTSDWSDHLVVPQPGQRRGFAATTKVSTCFDKTRLTVYQVSIQIHMIPLDEKFSLKRNK
jgi:hypothetical protein